MKLNKYACMKNILYSVYNGTWTFRQLGLCDDIYLENLSHINDFQIWYTLCQYNYLSKVEGPSEKRDNLCKNKFTVKKINIKNSLKYR